MSRSRKIALIAVASVAVAFGAVNLPDSEPPVRSWDEIQEDDSIFGMLGDFAQVMEDDDISLRDLKRAGWPEPEARILTECRDEIMTKQGMPDDARDELLEQCAIGKAYRYGYDMDL